MIGNVETNSLAIIGDIGATNASHFLSQMMNKEFRVSIPWIGYYPFEKIPRLFGVADKAMTCVHLNLGGDLSGTVLFLFPYESSLKVAALLQDQKPSEKLSEMDQSALKEAGNILTNAYLNAIAEKLDISITDSVPNLATDMLDATIEGVLCEMACRAQETIVLKNDYTIKKERIEAHALIIFDPNSNKKLLERLRECPIKLT